MKTPALLTRLSIRPNRSSAPSTTRPAVSGRAMSPPAPPAPGRLGSGDVALRGRDGGVVGRRHRARGAHDGVAGGAEPRHNPGADAARCAGDDRNPRWRRRVVGHASGPPTPAGYTR